MGLDVGCWRESRWIEDGPADWGNERLGSMSGRILRRRSGQQMLSMLRVKMLMGKESCVGVSNRKAAHLLAKMES